MTNMEARQATLALHTDLANLSAYADRPALLAELVLTIEERMNAIASHVAKVRASLGMRGAGTIVNINGPRAAA